MDELSHRVNLIASTLSRPMYLIERAPDAPLGSNPAMPTGTTPSISTMATERPSYRIKVEPIFSPRIDFDQVRSDLEGFLPIPEIGKLGGNSGMKNNKNLEK